MAAKTASPTATGGTLKRAGDKITARALRQCLSLCPPNCQGQNHVGPLKQNLGSDLHFEQVPHMVLIHAPQLESIALEMVPAIKGEF